MVTYTLERVVVSDFVVVGVEVLPGNDQVFVFIDIDYNLDVSHVK